MVRNRDPRPYWLGGSRHCLAAGGETVAGGMLHIEAERRQEEKLEEKGYLRREAARLASSGTR